MKSVDDEEASWTSRARCADMASDVFFPSDSVGVFKAIAICETCPVRQACLEHALEHGIVEGIWGGESERSRRRIRAARRQPAEGSPIPAAVRPTVTEHREELELDGTLGERPA